MAVNASTIHPATSIHGVNWQLRGDKQNSLNRTTIIQPNYKPAFKAAFLPAQESFGNELLFDLPADVYLRLQPNLQKVSFGRGQTIYDIGDTFDFVYFPLDFVASRLCLMEDGAMIEVGVVGREGLLGISAIMGAATASNLTVAETGGTALRVRTKLLRDLFRQNYKLQNTLLGYYNDLLAQVSQRAACRCRHTVAQQLCTWLLLIHDRAGNDDLNLTQETVANRLGARRASVTVALNNLEKTDCIQSRRGHIVVRNRECLENHACECYQLLRCELDSQTLQAVRVQ